MYLGIEIGGTKLQLGLGGGDGTLAALWRGGVDVARGGEGIREQIVREVPLLLERAGVSRDPVRGVGVGFGGPVDDADRTVIKSHQIAGWDGFPLAAWLEDLLGWPVALGNDANVAGLAESLFGAGKGLSPIFYITIGSGIGGGLIINGEIYRGCGRGAAELGHLPSTAAFKDGDEYPMKSDGWDPSVMSIDSRPLETFASGWAIAERAMGMVRGRVFDGSILRQMAESQRGVLVAADVARAASAGDRAASDLVLASAWFHLAEGICSVIALLCPRRIIIGGGVSLMGEQILFEPLRKLVAERVFAPFAGCYDIVPAALGEEVVVHGALALARRRLHEPERV
jgi:glucokinase